MNYKQQNENEVIIKLDGRMANQMFEWAFARAFEAKNGVLPLIDNSKETLKLNHFKLMKDLKVIHQPLWNKILRKIIIFRNLRNKITELKFDLPVYTEQTYYKFDENIYNCCTPIYLKGYFQCEKYLNEVREQLLKDFELTKPLNNKNKAMLDKIKNTESVSIHFRRGDYTKEKIAKRFGNLGLQYYYDAVKEVVKISDKKPTLFIFSDDIKWVRKNVKFDYETVYVDINNGKQGYLDLELMKKCKHNIIANSSFSWMSAWLNENTNKIVVAPKFWRPFIESFQEEYDLIPNDWRRVNAYYN